MKTRPMFFFAAPGEAAGASGSSAVSSTITPAGDADASIDPLNYVPPSTDDITKFVEGPAGADDAGPVGTQKKPDAAPAAKEPPSAKPPEKKPDPAPAPGAKPADDANAPASQLRGRLKELETERDTLKTQLESAKTDRRVDDLTAKIAEKDKAITAAEEARADYERKLLVHNPLVSKRLVDMRETFNREYASALELVPGMGPDYRNLLSEFQALPRGTDGYAEALKEFKGRLKDKFDDDMPTVFEALRKGHAFTVDHAKAADEIQRDAAKIDFEGRQKAWNDAHGSIEKEWDGYFKPPADAEANDPYNHNLFLQRFEEVLPKEEVARINASLKGYVSRIFNGPQPRTKADFPGMDDAAVQKELAGIEQRSTAEREEAKRVVAVALKFLTLARPIIGDWQKLKQRLGEKAGAQPPDPTGKTGVAAAAAGDDDLNVAMPSPEEIAASLR